MKLPITVLVVLLGISFTAAAADDVGGTDIWLGLSLMDFQYKEFSDQGALLDREDGPVLGGRLGLSAWHREMTLTAEFTYQAGLADYDGQLQDGTPHRTQTREQFYDASLAIGRQISAGTRLSLGGGYHQWDRDIQPAGSVGGLFERYSWWYLLGEVDQRLWQSGTHGVHINFRLIYPVNPTMRVNITGNPVVLSLGEQVGFRLQLPWRQRMDGGQQLEVSPYFEYWDLGASPAVISDGWIISEPRSETRNLGITLSLGF